MRSRFFGGAAAAPPFEVSNEEQFTLLKDMVDEGNYPDVTFTSHGFVYNIKVQHDYMQNMWYYTLQKTSNGEVIQEQTFPLDELIEKIREHHVLFQPKYIIGGGKRRKTQRKRTQRKRAQRRRKSSRRN